jgi:putative transposase
MHYDPSNLLLGDTHYFDVCLAETTDVNLTDHVDLLRYAVFNCQQKHPFAIAACVVLPRRVQMMLTLPAGDTAYSIRWHMIKTTFARHCTQPAMTLWHARFHNHLIQNQGDYDLHIDLIKSSPSQRGLVEDANDWPWVSVHNLEMPSTPVSAKPTTAHQQRIRIAQEAARLPIWLTKPHYSTMQLS